VLLLLQLDATGDTYVAVNGTERDAGHVQRERDPAQR
jgi:hypothetical protein